MTNMAGQFDLHGRPLCQAYYDDHFHGNFLPRLGTMIATIIDHFIIIMLLCTVRPTLVRLLMVPGEEDTREQEKALISP